MDAVHLLEAVPFDDSASETLSAVPAPFGSWVWSGNAFFDIISGGSEPIYAADGWYNTLPSDTPANQHYAPVLLSPFNFQVSLFDGLEPTGRAAIGFGDVVIDNSDGWLDSLIDLGWSGRPITLFRGTPGAARSSFVQVFQGAVDGLTPDEQRVSLRLRTREALLDRPLQSLLYAGTGGKEGGADLVGKRKPLAYGRNFNVPAVLVDAPNLVFQVHDGETEDVLAVRDRGIAITIDADYPTYGDLLLASIGSGECATCLAEGLVRLGAANAGTVTVDVWGDATGGYVETAAGIVRRIVTTRLDTVNMVDPDDLDTAAFTQLDLDQAAPLGFWDGPDSGLTVGQALDAIMSSVGGWWTFTLPGLLTVAILKAPSGPPDAVLERDDIVLGPALSMVGGVPSSRRLVGYQRAWAVQQDLASGVSPADQQLYGSEYRLATVSDAAVLAKHRNAREVLTAGLFAEKADAEAEALRLQALHGVERRVLTVRVMPPNPFDAPLGGVVELRDINRMTLQSTKLMRLVGLVVNLASGEVNWVLWG